MKIDLNLIQLDVVPDSAISLSEFIQIVD